jgi:hypothetical protein
VIETGLGITPSFGTIGGLGSENEPTRSFDDTSSES